MKRPDATVIKVFGEVDLLSASWLEEELRNCERFGLPVIVDLDGVEFMDGSGLRALLAAATRDTRGQFSVTPGSRQVQRLFTLTHAADHLRIRAR